MVREVLGHSGSSMTSAEIDLLFRALDSNKCVQCPGRNVVPGGLLDGPCLAALRGIRRRSHCGRLNPA